MLLQLVVGGMALGSMYGLVALGYHMTWVTSRTMNFSQGHAVMGGAVVAYALFVGLGLPRPPGLPAAPHRARHHRREPGHAHLRQGRPGLPLAAHPEAHPGGRRGLLSA